MLFLWNKFEKENIRIFLSHLVVFHVYVLNPMKINIPMSVFSSTQNRERCRKRDAKRKWLNEDGVSIPNLHICYILRYFSGSIFRITECLWHLSAWILSIAYPKSFSNSRGKWLETQWRIIFDGTEAILGCFMALDPSLLHSNPSCPIKVQILSKKREENKHKPFALFDFGPFVCEVNLLRIWQICLFCW